MKKTPWTASRVISFVLIILSIGMLLLGILWLTGGIQLSHTPLTSGEDFSPIGGFIFQLLGTGLIVIGGILAILFFWLYTRTTRRLKLNQSHILQSIGADSTSSKITK